MVGGVVLLELVVVTASEKLGATIDELKAAKIPVPMAKTIGIVVDSRRTNKSAESLAANVARLAEYKAKLVIFPKKGTKAKKGDTADAAKRAAATQCTDKFLMAPVKPAAAAAVEFVAVTDDMADFKAYQEIGRAHV